jgi:hypothetical protein
MYIKPLPNTPDIVGSSTLYSDTLSLILIPTSPLWALGLVASNHNNTEINDQPTELEEGDSYIDTLAKKDEEFYSGIESTLSSPIWVPKALQDL